jgi:hypothetical protein
MSASPIGKHWITVRPTGFMERVPMVEFGTEVVVKCPQTGETVPVGMEMTEAVFTKTTLYGNVFKCSSCRGTHVWRKQDAWIATRRPQEIEDKGETA